MANALFTINDDADDDGYDATPSEVLALRLKTLPPAGVTSVRFQIWDPDDFDETLDPIRNPPRQSKGAPLLELDNGVATGTSLSPVAIDGEVELTLEANVFVAYIIRCVVNNGMTTLADGRVVVDRSLIHERMVVVRENGVRPIVATETTQYEPDGWAGAYNEGGGPAGDDGGFGGAMSIPYVFSTTTTDTDPGATFIRLGNATQNLSTVMRADLLDANNVDVTALLATFDDSAAGVKGIARLVHRDDDSKHLLFYVTALSSPAGYRNITIVPIGSSSASPFVNGDPVVLCFDPMGGPATIGKFDPTAAGAIFTCNFDSTLIDETNANNLVVDAGTVDFCEGWPGRTFVYVETTGRLRVAATPAPAVLRQAGELTIHSLVLPDEDPTAERVLVMCGAGGVDTDTANNTLYQQSIQNVAAPLLQLRAFHEEAAGANVSYNVSVRDQRARVPVLWTQVRRISAGQAFYQNYVNGRPAGAESGGLVPPTGGGNAVFVVAAAGSGSTAGQRRIIGGQQLIAAAQTAAQVLAVHNRVMGPAFGFLV